MGAFKDYDDMLAKSEHSKRLTERVLIFLIGIFFGLILALNLVKQEQGEPVKETVYNYDRLTLDTCITDTECHIAEAVNQYAIYDSLPVVEPLDCEGLTGKELDECNEHNKFAGVVGHNPHEPDFVPSKP